MNATATVTSGANSTMIGNSTLAATTGVANSTVALTGVNATTTAGAAARNSSANGSTSRVAGGTPGNLGRNAQVVLDLVS